MNHISKDTHIKKYWSIVFIVAVTVWNPPLARAANYNIGTLNVTTFESEVTLNGTVIPLTNADTLTFAGGTMTITGDGSEYSAILGTGAGAQAGFNWGTGGTVDLAQDVTLSIDVTAGSSSPLTAISLTQNGAGTLVLTSPDMQNLALTQNSGTLRATGDVQTLGRLLINGSVSTSGDFIANANSTAVETATINGTLAVAGEYHDIADQTNVNGTLTAQTANFTTGGLVVASGGHFRITNQAIFSEETAIVNHGQLEVGDNSQLHSTTVADAGTLTIGNGSEFTGLVSCTGSLIANGTIDFNYVFINGTLQVNGDATIDGEFHGGTGTSTFEQSASFDNIVDLQNDIVVTIKGNAEFQNTLTVDDTAELNVLGNVTSNANINVTDGTLVAGENIDTTGSLSMSSNSTLGLSTRLQGSDLGNVQAQGGINLDSTTTITTDLSGLTTVNQPTLLVHMTAGDSTDNFQVDGAPTDTTVVAAFFGTSTALRKIYAVDNGSGYDIYGNLLSIRDEAVSEGLLPPAIEAGSALDDLINQSKPSDPTSGMVDDLLNQTDKDVINQTLYNLAGGYGVENIFAMTLVNLGQAGSPFFFGKPTGLPQANQPYCSICRQADCGQYNDDWELWGAPFYQSLDSKGNFFQHGFNLHEAGLIVGARKNHYSRVSVGVLFAYGAPRLRQSGELLGYDARYHSDLDLDDYQFAGHLEYETQNNLRFSFFVGGGAQRLSLNRNAYGTASNGTDMNRSFSGDTDGNTLSVTAYLSRPFQFGKQTVLSPVIGIDCMYAWLYAFGEDSSGTGNWQDMTNLSEGNFYSPVNYGKTDYNRIMARAGLALEYSGDCGGLACQAFYGTQLGGDDFAIVPVSTLGGLYNSQIYGYGIGRDSLNLGCGLWRFLDTKQTLTASISYNYFTLNDADASNVTAALAWRY